MNKEILDFKKAKELVSKLDLNNAPNIFEILRTINLNKILIGFEKINKFYDCPFIDGNVGWVSKNEENHYRYFTRNCHQVTYSMDFADLYGIITNTNSKKLVKRLIEDFNLVNLDSPFKNRERIKVLENFNLLDDVLLSNEAITSYIGNSMIVYKALCKENISKLIDDNSKHKNNSIFYASLMYLNEQYGLNMSKPTMSRHVNLLATIGLITKLKTEEIPENLMTKCEEYKYDFKKKHNHISFFTINKLNSKSIDEMVYKVEKLIEHKIKPYKINEEVLKTVFTDEFADSIFVQKFKRSKKVMSKIEENNSKKSFLDFLLRMDIVDTGYRMNMLENGYISKEKLREQSELTTHAFNEYWKKLMKDYSLTTIRPTKELKEKLNLKTYQSLVILSFEKTISA